jgi:NAD(P)-dependent dehydrogenase (short-subunit alcohol dehydrogenase family)
MEVRMADVVLITGCSTGLGRAAALHLARRAYRVHATMRSPEAGAPLMAAARDEGLSLSVSALDVTDAGQCEKAVRAVLDESGRIDVLVNNAGLGDLGAVEDVTDADVSRMFETNVFGPLRLMRLVLPGMRAAGKGAIVNISSTAGRFCYGSGALYSGTKHALESISECLALEVMQHGIRVAIIEPGFFDTPIIDKAVATVPEASSPYAHVIGRAAAIYQGSKAGPIGDPDDVARAIEEAITSETPRLRYVCGVDAPVLLGERAKMTDEEYLHAFGRKQTDEEWFAEFIARFPIPGA